jgi:4,5-dihydroxyphthalate decarboxylase
VEELWRTMGQDFWPYGLKANQHALETYIQYLSEQHLIDRKPAFEELFARNALD